MSADALAALIRLNEHARAPDWEWGGTPGRVVPMSVIYGLKAQAIRVFTWESRATHRPIVFRSPCGTCGGSGWYRRDEENGCRTCGGISGPGGDKGRGYKDLRFVETTIHALGLAAFRWHETNTSATQLARRREERLRAQREHLALTQRARLLQNERVLGALYRVYQMKRVLLRCC